MSALDFQRAVRSWRLLRVLNAREALRRGVALRKLKRCKRLQSQIDWAAPEFEAAE